MRQRWLFGLALGIAVSSLYGDVMPVQLFPGISGDTTAGSHSLRSRVIVSNPTVAPQPVLLELLPSGSARPSAARQLLLAPGERRDIDDLDAFLGSDGGAGMLRVSGVARTKVNLRTADDAAVPQELAPVEGERPLAANEEVEFSYLTPADERDAHSNLLLVNLDTKDVTVTFREGSIAAVKTIPAGAFVQIEDFGNFLGTAPGIQSARAVGDGRWSGTIMTARTLAVGQRRRSVAPPEPRASSFGLIDAALASGTINAEQALTYKVFSDFHDPRLPAAFSGDDSERTEADSPALAAQQWSTLSQATKDVIGPYLIPAFYEGSWWYLRRAAAKSIRPLELGCKPFETFAGCKFGKEWTHADGSHVRVWFEVAQTDDLPVAFNLVKETDNVIWPELIKVMGRTPLLSDEIDGTKLLDAVLTDNLDAGVLATTFPLGTGCMYGATYVAVLRGQTNVKDRNSAFAHELFHSVQHAYNTNGGSFLGCMEYNYKWLMESTATWFEDELYPDVNREQFFSKFYLNHTDLSIDTTVGLDSKGITGHRYGAYVFFFYLTRIAGGDPTTLVRKVWEATESGDAIHALKTGLEQSGLPLDKSWPGFALYAWNRGAPYDRFQTIPSKGTPEALGYKSQIQDTFDVAGETEHQLGNGGDKLPHVSIRYYRVNFSGAASSSVVLYNGLKRALGHEAPPNTPASYGEVYRAKTVSDPSVVKGAHVDVLIKIAGEDQWKHEDLTESAFRYWCRDLTAERVESLIVILSNSDIENTLNAQQGNSRSLIFSSNIGCYAWEGSATLSYLESNGRHENMTVTDLRLEQRPTSGPPPPDIDYLAQQNFNVVKGTFSFSASGAFGGCAWSGSDSGTLVDPRNFLIVYPFHRIGSAAYHGIMPGLAQAWLEPRTNVKETCGSPPVTNNVLWGAGSEFFWVMLPTKSFAKLSADGQTYDLDAGNLDDNKPKQLSGRWHLEAKRQ